MALELDSGATDRLGQYIERLGRQAFGGGAAAVHGHRRQDHELPGRGQLLEIVSATRHAPIDFELYLPESWANDPERRNQARIPKWVIFQTKAELALGMIERARRAGIPGEILLADSEYGQQRLEDAA